MAEQVEHEVLVCDNGTGFVKCGFAGEVQTNMFLLMFQTKQAPTHDIFFLPSPCFRCGQFLTPFINYISYCTPLTQTPPHQQ
jgi:hypothetical protein